MGTLLGTPIVHAQSLRQGAACQFRTLHQSSAFRQCDACVCVLIQCLLCLHTVYIVCSVVVVVVYSAHLLQCTGAPRRGQKRRFTLSIGQRQQWQHPPTNLLCVCCSEIVCARATGSGLLSTTENEIGSKFNIRCERFAAVRHSQFDRYTTTILLYALMAL